MIIESKSVLTANEVAELLGFRRDYIYQLARRGEIPAKRIGQRYWRFNRIDIEKWISNGN